MMIGGQHVRRLVTLIDRTSLKRAYIIWGREKLEQKKNLPKAKEKNKARVNETSVVGLQKEKKRRRG